MDLAISRDIAAKNSVAIDHSRRDRAIDNDVLESHGFSADLDIQERHYAIGLPRRSGNSKDTVVRVSGGFTCLSDHGGVEKRRLSSSVERKVKFPAGFGPHFHQRLAEPGQSLTRISTETKSLGTPEGDATRSIIHGQVELTDGIPTDDTIDTQTSLRDSYHRRPEIHEGLIDNHRRRVGDNDRPKLNPLYRSGPHWSEACERPDGQSVRR